MADTEPKIWITVNGRHIPIYNKGNALNKSIAQANADIKSRQIAENKRQADSARDAQKRHRVNPKNLPLEDIPAEEANRTSDVLNLRTRKRYRFKDGTKITQVEAFAGRGCKREFRDAPKYAKKYGGKPKDWQHCSGNAVLTNGYHDFKREVHWVQGADGKMRDAFIKEYPKKLEKRK